MQGNDGQLHKLVAAGLDWLTHEAKGGDLQAAYFQFQRIAGAEIICPTGEVDILLGQDFAGFLPRVEKLKGHILLLSSMFSMGRLLSGRTGVNGEQIYQHKLTP